jgi:hypothetical protein
MPITHQRLAGGRMVTACETVEVLGQVAVLGNLLSRWQESFVASFGVLAEEIAK